MKIGVLALQGAFIEHEYMLQKLGIDSFEIRQKKDLEQTFDGIIIPGGESTVIGKLLRELDLFYPIQDLIKNELPVFGTCAGLILLAKEVLGETSHLATMDIKVKRNGYGRQINSFNTNAHIEKVSDTPIPLVFIRAPFITEVGPEVEILHSIDGKIVAAKQKNMLVTSFHPELTNDLSFLKYFINMIQ